MLSTPARNCKWPRTGRSGSSSRVPRSISSISMSTLASMSRNAARSNGRAGSTLASVDRLASLPVALQQRHPARRIEAKRAVQAAAADGGIVHAHEPGGALFHQHARGTKGRGGGQGHAEWVAHGGQRRPAQAEAPADAVQVVGICNLASELQAGAAYGGFQCQWQRCVAATDSARPRSAGADQFCLEWLAAIRAGGLQLQAPGAAFTCADRFVEAQLRIQHDVQRHVAVAQRSRCQLKLAEGGPCSGWGGSARHIPGAATSVADPQWATPRAVGCAPASRGARGRGSGAH
jgi:hypothetical protein